MFSSRSLESWGFYPKHPQTESAHPQRNVNLPQITTEIKSLLPRGLGRSYGDSCLNSHLLSTRALDHFIHFDPKAGTLTCESGVSLTQILKLIVPQGWFIPVSPGTQFVTVGGAIANDIHGKNHHGAGNFGNHVLQFELLRSDGSRRICSPTQNPQWFAATVGGLGLTGLITWAQIQLKPIYNAFICQETIKFKNFEEFFDLTRESEKNFEYTVAWIDCLSTGKYLGRGHFIRGNHAPVQTIEQLPFKNKRNLTVPFHFPSVTLNKLTVKAFNTFYYNRQMVHKKESLVHYDPFFYPLDSIYHWNRIYGKPGFLQYQVVVPCPNGDSSAIKHILNTTARAGAGSFLAVMKVFGSVPPMGMLSFPRPGVTLTLDFSTKTKGIFKLLDTLDAFVVQVGGALYPAKDARMAPATFKASFPQWEAFVPFMDPHFSSYFWQRMQL